MNWLEQYGEPIFDYHGSGNFQSNPLPLLEDELPPVSFEVVQLPDGRIFCECRLLSPDAKYKFPDEDTLIGHTEYGFPITISKLVPITRVSVRMNEERYHIMVTGEIEVKAPTRIGSEQRFNIEFYLTNFGFDAFWPEPLQWSIGKYLITLEPLPNYKETVKIIRGTRKTDVTAKVTIGNIGDLAEISEVIVLVDNFCSLLSLAQGCHVRWICYAALSKTRIVVKYHQIVGPLSPTGPHLIPSHSPSMSNPERDFQEYIAQCLPSYKDKEQVWRISHIISLYVEAIGQEVLVNRGLRLGVLMDVIRGTYAGNSGRDRLIDQETFERISEDLKKELKKILKELLPQSTNEQRGKIISHIPIFQWYPFRISLMAMRKALKLNVSDNQIALFIKQRDNLTHRYQFIDSNKQVESCNEMMNIVSKTILAILEYDGYYYDRTIRPNRDWSNRRVKNLYIKADTK